MPEFIYEERPMLTVKLLQTTQEIKMLESESRVYNKWQTSAIIIVCYTAVFSVVTQRDDTKNGCVADYDYQGDFRLSSGDREERSRIWSLADYPGELTALYLFLDCQDYTHNLSC